MSEKNVEILISVKDLIQTQNSYLADIRNQLDEINTNMDVINAYLAKESFWNSQLFAAIVGAGSALSIFMIKYIIDHLKKRSIELKKFYLFIVEQSDFYSPSGLLEEANGHQHFKQKNIGEKMKISLRERVKYWNIPYGKIVRLFKKYEKIISATTQENQDETIERAGKIYKKIVNLSCKKTGESEWTI